MLKLVAVLSLVAVGGVEQQPQNCASRERRTAAIQFARQINSAEAAAYSQAPRYVALSELLLPSDPDGFHIQLASDGMTYTFSIKDTTDACQGALFSDQEGLIYTGAPLQ